MATGSKDTLLRYIETLNLIPRAPHKIATTTLAERLRENGYSVTSRTLQRDLDKLSGRFPIQCDDDSKPFRWWFDAGSRDLFPITDTSVALAMCLAEPHLRNRLPQEVFQKLRPQFARASQQLMHMNSNRLAVWPERIRSLPSGKTLIPAQICDNVWTAVSEALMSGKQLQVEYNSRSSGEVKTLRLHPLGLVVRDSSTYLVCTTNDYQTENLYALHRMLSAEMIYDDARMLEGFDLDDFIRKGTFGWAPKGDVTFKAEISADIARMLGETRLSHQQTITPIVDKQGVKEGEHEGEQSPKPQRFLLEAIVPDDQEILWWIYGMNTSLKVLEPLHWVEAIRARLHEWLVMYEENRTETTAATHNPPE